MTRSVSSTGGPVVSSQSESNGAAMQAIGRGRTRGEPVDTYRAPKPSGTIILTVPVSSCRTAMSNESALRPQVPGKEQRIAAGNSTRKVVVELALAPVSTSSSYYLCHS